MVHINNTITILSLLFCLSFSLRVLDSIVSLYPECKNLIRILNEDDDELPETYVGSLVNDISNLVKFWEFSFSHINRAGNTILYMILFINNILVSFKQKNYILNALNNFWRYANS